MADETIGSLGELTYEECLALLGGEVVGRLAVIVDGGPQIFPVNYALDGELVVFRSDPGTKLDHANLDRVAFEIDGVDPATRTGWSVVVTGTAREVTEATDARSARERSLSLDPWSSGAKRHWIRIARPHITGRRLERQPRTDGVS